MLKDNLIEQIYTKVENESKFNVYFQNIFSSIDELLKMYYTLYRDYKISFDKITYRKTEINIYDSKDKDFITLKEEIQKQINVINEELDGE